MGRHGSRRLETARVINCGLEGQRGNDSYTGHRHAPPADRINSDDGLHFVIKLEKRPVEHLTHFKQGKQPFAFL
jgi:hypothetical protein